MIVIDPVRTPTAQAADLHLQPFPGSDAALAFALVHVIWREGRIDRDFIARHTVGWEEITWEEAYKFVCHLIGFSALAMSVIAEASREPLGKYRV